MTRPRLVNLLDDFALGGVSRGLGIFASQPVLEVADASTFAVAPDAVLAPKLDADIIVTHFPPNWRRLAFYASLRLRNPAARIIHVEHSYTHAWETLKVRHSRRFRLMLRLALNLVDHVVCVSSGQAAWLKHAASLPSSKVDVILPYSDNPGLSQVPLPQFDQPRRLTVGAYGRFHVAKGFDRLIAAYRDGAMPGTELLIGGYGDLEGELRELAGETPGIRFAGKIDDVAAFLGQCDIIAVPSRWEAYGQVANEAREAGRPILVAPVDGLPEQVGQAGMVVDFSSSVAVAEAFACLDSQKLAAMAAAGRRATDGCGLMRQQKWAKLIRRLSFRGSTQLFRPAEA